MPALKDKIKQLLREFDKFSQFGSGLTLRAYQQEPAKAIIDSIIKKQGLSFVVIFPRQSGKNELQAQIQTYLLTIFLDNFQTLIFLLSYLNPFFHIF